MIDIGNVFTTVLLIVALVVISIGVVHVWYAHKTGMSLKAGIAFMVVGLCGIWIQTIPASFSQSMLRIGWPMAVLACLYLSIWGWRDAVRSGKYRELELRPSLRKKAAKR